MDKNNIDNILKPDVRNEIEERLRRIQIEQKYIQNKLPEGAIVSEISNRQFFNFTEMSIRREATDVLLLKVREQEREYTKILNYSETIIEQQEISRVANKLKLSEQDITDLLNKGLGLKLIEENGIEIIKESNKSNRSISPQKLKENILEEFTSEKVNQVTISHITDKEVIIFKLDELGEVDEYGNFVLSEDLKNQLRPFESKGIIDLDTKLSLVKERERTEEHKLGRDVYKAIPEDILDKKMQEEKAERQEIAEALNENPNNIVGIIRVLDRETCSQLLNDDSIKNASDEVLIVRFRNNRFKAMKEDESGNKTELTDFSVTPVLENIAPTIENKVGNLYSTFKVGDITAGKRVDGQRYDTFYVDTGTRGDGIGNLIVVNSDGENTMDFVKPTQSGGYDIEFADSERVYPSTLIMDSKDGDKVKEVKIEEDRNKEDEKQEDIAYKVAQNYTGNIEEEKALLEELLKIDDEIFELQNSPRIEFGTTMKNVARGAAIGHALGDEGGMAIGGAVGLQRGIEESGKNIDERIEELESRREEVLSRLGYSSKDLVQAREEAQMVHEHRPY